MAFNTHHCTTYGNLIAAYAAGIRSKERSCAGTGSPGRRLLERRGAENFREKHNARASEISLCHSVPKCLLRSEVEVAALQEERLYCLHVCHGCWRASSSMVFLVCSVSGAPSSRLGEGCQGRPGLRSE